jgi:hypothetical protein
LVNSSPEVVDEGEVKKEVCDVGQEEREGGGDDEGHGGDLITVEIGGDEQVEEGLHGRERPHLREDGNILIMLDQEKIQNLWYFSDD